jgi:hypothetical protein
MGNTNSSSKLKKQDNNLPPPSYEAIQTQSPKNINPALSGGEFSKMLVPRDCSEDSVSMTNDSKLEAPQKPVLYEFIMQKLADDKARQVAEYEQYINNWKSSFIGIMNKIILETVEKREFEHLLKFDASTFNNNIAEIYRNAELTKLYTQKKIDFMFENYPKFKIVMSEDLPTYTLFKLCLN